VVFIVIVVWLERHYDHDNDNRSRKKKAVPLRTKYGRDGLGKLRSSKRGLVSNRSEGTADEDHDEQGHGFNNAEGHQVVAETLARFRQGIRGAGAGTALQPG